MEVRKPGQKRLVALSLELQNLANYARDLQAGKIHSEDRKPSRRLHQIALTCKLTFDTSIMTQDIANRSLSSTPKTMEYKPGHLSGSLRPKRRKDESIRHVKRIKDQYKDEEQKNRTRKHGSTRRSHCTSQTRL